MHGRTAKIVQRHYAAHHRRERPRNLRIAGVCVMHRTLHQISSDAGVEGRLHLRGRAAEHQRAMRSRNLLQVEAVTL